MSRPRIRTIKPENWQDEAVGSVSREARLLRDVLLTYADDDGRWRHRYAGIVGFGYQYDDDMTPAKFGRWVGELSEARIIHVYDADGNEYGCFPRWHLHQHINKYQPSSLPAPSRIKWFSREEASAIKKGELPADAGSATGEVPEADATRNGAAPVAGDSPRTGERVPSFP